MRSVHLVALAAALICSGCVNFFPRNDIPFEASDNTDAVRKVGSVIEVSGLSPSPITEPAVGAGIGHPIEVLAVWKWPSRPSFGVAVIRRLPPDQGYWLNIEDSKTGGTKFVGSACQKYLEIVADLKAQSGISSPGKSQGGCEMNPKNSN